MEQLIVRFLRRQRSLVAWRFGSPARATNLVSLLTASVVLSAACQPTAPSVATPSSNVFVRGAATALLRRLDWSKLCSSREMCDTVLVEARLYRLKYAEVDTVASLRLAELGNSDLPVGAGLPHFAFADPATRRRASKPSVMISVWTGGARDERLPTVVALTRSPNEPLGLTFMARAVRTDNRWTIEWVRSVEH